ncbi:MAG: hypothetical protein R3C02_22975 [Planctomycetaceae bacterium]
MRFRDRIRVAAMSLLLLAIGQASASDTPETASRATLILVQGAPGTDQYARMFDEWSQQWKAAAELGDVTVHDIGSDVEPSPKDVLQQVIVEASQEHERPLWIVLIGHGTFDGRAAKFNLTGPDVSAKELAEWLDQVSRPLAIVNCASASSPFVDQLSLTGRVVITATRSGSEVNFTRFGGFIANAIGDISSDLDKDGQVSLLEAFLTASRQTTADYEGLGQLVTEHALLDDTGDARGTTADFFEGIRTVKIPEGGETLDGHVAHQWHLIPSDEERRFPDELRPRRDELELEIALLRDRKSEMEEDAYYSSLELLLVELARLYEQADGASQNNPSTLDDLPPGEAESETREENPAR